MSDVSEETTAAAIAGADGEDGEGAGAGPDMPPVPDYIREAGRQAPDHWFGMIDPAWSGGGNPPEWALIGQWRSDLDGEIVEWQDNEEYRPSPKALDWPDPTDPVDVAVQLAATGYGPAEDVNHALAGAEVAVLVAPGGAPLAAVAPDGETPVIPVFTAPEHLHAAGRLSFQTLKVPELLDQLPEGHLLYLNPSGAVSMTVEPSALREAAVSADDSADHEGGWLGALDDLLPAPVAPAGADDVRAAQDGRAGAAVPPAPVAPALDGSVAASDVVRGDFL